MAGVVIACTLWLWLCDSCHHRMAVQQPFNGHWRDVGWLCNGSQQTQMIVNGRLLVLLPVQAARGR